MLTIVARLIPSRGASRDGFTYLLQRRNHGAPSHDAAAAAEGLHLTLARRPTARSCSRAPLQDSQYAEAINAFRQALRINPQDANAWYDLGLTYIEAGQNSQALVAYRRLKALSPELAQKLLDRIEQN